MQIEDKRAFQSMMITVMALYYKPSLDKDALRVWWQKLEKYDFNTVSRAFNVFTDSPNKPPTPADIIELCKAHTIRKAQEVPKLTRRFTPEQKDENHRRLVEMLDTLNIRRLR
jgi:hypothetical protein